MGISKYIDELYFIYESSRPIRVDIGYLKTCGSVQRDKLIFLLLFLGYSFVEKNSLYINS
jgi:hypothetical protein